MSMQFDNNASGTLSVQAVGATPGPEDLTLTLQTNEGTLFPPVTTVSGDFFYVTLEDTAGNFEIARCTNNVADVLTVTRAQENTTSQTFAVGSKVEQRMTAGTLAEFMQRTGATMTGILNMNGQELSDAVMTSTGSGQIKGVPLQAPDGGATNEITIGNAGADPQIGTNTIVHTGNDTAYVQTTRTITGGEGIAAMGDLSANRVVDMAVDELTAMSGTDLLAADLSLVYDTANTIHKKIEYKSQGVPIIVDATTNPTPTSDEVNAYWICTNATTVNFDIDTGIGEKGNVLIVQQGSAIQVDFTGSTATINSSFVNDTTNQLNSVAVLVCTATNTWTLYGDCL